MKWEQKFLKTCESSSDKEIRSLPALLQQTYEYLSSLPTEINEEYMLAKKFERLMKEDYATGIIVYWKEIDERIKFLWQSIGFKGLSLLEDIVACVNSENYYPALVLARALLENVAVLHYYLYKIKIAYSKVIETDVIGKVIRKEIKALVVSEELENLLIKYSHGTTLKKLIKIQEKWKQTRISKYINFLSENKKYTKASDYYSFLCQIAHPSFGSTWVFHKKSYIVDEKEIHKFSNKQNLNFFLEVSSYPLIISCKILKDEIEQLRNIMFT